jgi:flagellar protein FliO/FliZ
VDTVFLALRVVVSLAVVLGAIWFVQKRMGRGSRGKSKSKPISVVARQNVGAKASVAVVEFGGKRFLLGVTEHAVSVLDAGEIPAAEVAAVLEATVEKAAEKKAAEKKDASAQDFADALSEAQGDSPAALKPASSRLAGSVLSASTWKQAFTALRGDR